MKTIFKFTFMMTCILSLSGCLVTTVVGGAVSAVKTTVSTAVDVVDAVTPDILD